MLRRFAAHCACVLAASMLAGAFDARAAGNDANICVKESGDAAIDACSRAIQSKRYTGHVLARQYLSRGVEQRAHGLLQDQRKTPSGQQGFQRAGIEKADDAAFDQDTDKAGNDESEGDGNRQRIITRESGDIKKHRRHSVRHHPQAEGAGCS